MKRNCNFSAIVLVVFFIATAPQVQAASWRLEQVDQLKHWVRTAPEDALPVLDMSGLVATERAGGAAAIDDAATALALRLARMHLLGSSKSAQRTGWHIADPDRSIDLQSWMERALAGNALHTFFASLRPKHPDYAALRAAYAREKDPEQRNVVARNMERWRWLPRSLGKDYVLVNAAFFEAHLWRDGAKVGTWPVIVGKRSTPTPVFSATITGVIFNPWWNVPASIVREKRGRFPSSRGYVRSGGRWRQKPGPGNALGQMKLVMPNPYSVFMHDTPSKSLFKREVRAFSHGCIRTGNALGFATTLLKTAKTREQVDAIVASRKTTQVDLPASLPLYVTYFTAATQEDGTVAVQPDIYRRDRRLGDAPDPGPGCAD